MLLEYKTLTLNSFIDIRNEKRTLFAFKLGMRNVQIYHKTMQSGLDAEQNRKDLHASYWLTVAGPSAFVRWPKNDVIILQMSLGIKVVLHSCTKHIFVFIRYI